MEAVSVQQTEGVEDTDRLSTEWCLLVKGNLVEMNVRRRVEMYIQEVHFPFVPCSGLIPPRCGPYQLTETNGDRLALFVVALDHCLWLRIVHLALCLIGVSREAA